MLPLKPVISCYRCSLSCPNVSWSSNYLAILPEGWYWFIFTYHLSQGSPLAVRFPYCHDCAFKLDQENSLEPGGLWWLHDHSCISDFIPRPADYCSCLSTGLFNFGCRCKRK